ncbi:MAG: DUF4056 domain-containing protein [Planctomycetota bacterium]|jgi:hypothetical protein
MKARYRHIAVQATAVAACLLTVLLTGCGGGGFSGGTVKGPPKGRVGRYASTSLGTVFMDAGNVGKHHYYSGWAEKNGIVYTCRGGHIDIAHVRKAADWTAYTAANILNQLEQNKTEFTFRLKEASRHHVRLKYPEWWKDLPEDERARIRKDIAVGLGQYFAYIGGAWHEIITWFGYRSTGIYPEFPSAFAWEDSFSDLFGTYLAAKALRDTENEYDEAFTIALDRELKKLGPQSGRTARRASDSVRGLWFSGDFLFLMDMKARNFDIGMDDGYITPWLVPYLDECAGAVAQPYPAPNFDFLKEYGFEINYEFEPREMQRHKILKIVYGKTRQKRLVPSVHFPKIMKYIRNDAVVNHGSYIEGNNKTSAERKPRGSAEIIRGDPS